jgi:hypothetical protein
VRESSSGIQLRIAAFGEIKDELFGIRHPAENIGWGTYLLKNDTLKSKTSFEHPLDYMLSASIISTGLLQQAGLLI